MKIGVSGHRHREGADWAWVRARLEELIAHQGSLAGYTSLAPGADQIFAEIVLAQNKPLVAVVPVCRGRVELRDEDKPAFDRFYSRAGDVIEVEGTTPDEAFLSAGKRVADLADLMIFIWDGEPSLGLGGTADIVAYAATRGVKGVILDPIACTVREFEAQR